MPLRVATESIAVLGALLLTRTDSDGLAFTCLALFCLGLVLYLIVMTMVFLRWTFVSLEPTEADPPAWIAAGAVAITVLAGANLLLAQDAAPRIARVAPAIEVVVVLASRRMIDATDLTGLDWLPPLVLAVALTAWTLTFVGLVTTTSHSWRSLGEPLTRP
jgi:Voltage-dependent anion channel